VGGWEARRDPPRHGSLVSRREGPIAPSRSSPDLHAEPIHPSQPLRQPCHCRGQTMPSVWRIWYGPASGQGADDAKRVENLVRPCLWSGGRRCQACGEFGTALPLVRGQTMPSSKRTCCVLVARRDGATSAMQSWWSVVGCWVELPSLMDARGGWCGCWFGGLESSPDCRTAGTAGVESGEWSRRMSAALVGWK